MVVCTLTVTAWNAAVRDALKRLLSKRTIWYFMALAGWAMHGSQASNDNTLALSRRNAGRSFPFGPLGLLAVAQTTRVQVVVQCR